MRGERSQVPEDKIPPEVGEGGTSSLEGNDREDGLGRLKFLRSKNLILSPAFCGAKDLRWHGSVADVAEWQTREA